MSEKHTLSLLSILDQIRSIALEGLKYGDNEYDKMRYNRLLEIASQNYGDTLRIDPQALLDSFISHIGINTPKVGVDLIVLNPQGQTLVLKRAQEQTWCLPGGWIDVGESPYTAATRELEEETGIHNISPHAMIMCIHKGPHQAECLYHQVCLGILMQTYDTKDPIRLSHEHTQFDWISTLEGRPWHYGHDDILEKVFDYQRKTQDLLLAQYPNKILFSQ